MLQGKSHTGYVCFTADFLCTCISLSEVGESAFGYLGGTCVVEFLFHLSQILYELLPQFHNHKNACIQVFSNIVYF